MCGYNNGFTAISIGCATECTALHQVKSALRSPMKRCHFVLEIWTWRRIGDDHEDECVYRGEGVCECMCVYGDGGEDVCLCVCVCVCVCK